MHPVASIKEWARQRRRMGKWVPSLGLGENRLVVILVLTLIGLVATLGVTLRFLSPEGGGQNIGFDRLRTLASAKAIDRATLYDFDHRVIGVVKPATARSATAPPWAKALAGRQFTAGYPSSDAETPFLIDTLVESGARVDVVAQSDKAAIQFVATYVMPLVILANLFALIFIGARGAGGDAVGGLADFSGIGGDRAKIGGTSGGGSGRITFADVAGAGNALVELAEVKEYLTDPGRFAAIGATPPKGVMMFGPPGCGKTLMAKAVAGEAGVPFFSISGAEFVESLVGVGAARVRDLFRKVRAVAPAIVFIDEIDAAGRRRGGVAGGQEEREQTLNQLLIEMDGFETSTGLVVMAATNRPDILDPALLRPGRFDRQVTVEPPDFEGRIDILALYASKRPMTDDVDLREIAKRTPGFTGAELNSVINEAALLTVRAGKTAVEQATLYEAVERVKNGPKRRGHVLSDDERRRAAFHEAAHALVGTVTGRLNELPKISLVAHGRTLGQAQGGGWAERTLLTRGELRGELMTLMAGTAAEEMMFGESSTGSDGDIERATQVAQSMVGRYGMSDRMGKVRMLMLDGNEFLGADLQPSPLVGESTLAELHAEVKLLIDEADDAAKTILKREKKRLAAIADVLLDRESLEPHELEPFLGALRPASVVDSAVL